MLIVHNNKIINLHDARYIYVNAEPARVSILIEMARHFEDDNRYYIMVFYTEEELNDWLNENMEQEGFDFIAKVVKKHADFDKAYELLKRILKYPSRLKEQKRFIKEALNHVDDKKRIRLLRKALKTVEEYETVVRILRDKKSLYDMTEDELSMIRKMRRYKFEPEYSWSDEYKLVKILEQIEKQEG